ncbi:MAG: hypothetical protein J5884_06575 [Paludibacteraceae bacterium]|nr:hypothetical protein [Paludibacteraceae bacterium]
MSQEQVFVEVGYLLDELKQEQQDVQWENLFRNIRQDFHVQDTSVPDHELDCIAITIVYTLASILAVSYPMFYHKLSEQLMLQVVKIKSVVPQSALDNLMDGIEKYDKAIAQWLKKYMESDAFMSDVFASYLSSNQIIEGTHIRFTKTATIDQRAEFTSILHRIISSGKKQGLAGDIRAHLNRNIEDSIIEISGYDKDIYNELVAYWGYKQRYNTFMDANPILIRKRH